jgi:hypothetical protein
MMAPTASIERFETGVVTAATAAALVQPSWSVRVSGSGGGHAIPEAGACK